ETKSVAAKSKGATRVTPCIPSAGETALSSTVIRKSSGRWPTLGRCRALNARYSMHSNSLRTRDVVKFFLEYGKNNRQLSLRHYQAEVTRYRNFCNGFIKRHQEVGELLQLYSSEAEIARHRPQSAWCQSQTFSAAIISMDRHRNWRPSPPSGYADA